MTLTAGQWFFPGTPISSTNKTDCHDITDILFKVPLNTLNPNQLNLTINGTFTGSSNSKCRK